MGENKVLKIITHNHSNKNIYIEKATINGNALDQSWFKHNDIKDGATIEFFMSDIPGDFGKENLPPSLNNYE